MKTVECFSCDLSRGCEDCEYRLDSNGYAYIKKTHFKRADEFHNHYYPENPMPEKGFVVHHKNENRLDDSRENIEKKTEKKHKQDHMNGKQYSLGCKHSEEQNAKNSERMKGNQYGIANKGCKRSDEFKDNLKGNQHGKGSKHPHSEETKEKIRLASLGNQNAKGKRSEESNKKNSVSKLKYWEDIRSGKRTRKSSS